MDLIKLPPYSLVVKYFSFHFFFSYCSKHDLAITSLCDIFYQIIKKAANFANRSAQMSIFGQMFKRWDFERQKSNLPKVSI